MLRSLGKFVKYFGFGALCMGLVVVAITPWITDPLATLGRGPAVPDGGDTGQPGYAPAFGAPDLETLAVIVERPLFTATRRPAPPVQPSPAATVAEPVDPSLILGRYRLTGIVVTPGLRMVFVTEPGSRKTIAVARGKELDGWLVSEVEQHVVVLESGDRRQRIKIGDDAHIEISSE